jgi:hypothetical protein
MVYAVPEPATWGLMMVGLFGVGMTMCKSRKTDLLGPESADRFTVTKCGIR